MRKKRPLDPTCIVTAWKPGDALTGEAQHVERREVANHPEPNCLKSCLIESSKIELNFVNALNLENLQCHAMSCPVLAKPQVRTCFAPELSVFRHNSFGWGSLAQEDFKRARAEFEPAPKWSHTWHMSLRELCTFMILSCLFSSIHIMSTLNHRNQR
jgi:hypothetical protein